MTRSFAESATVPWLDPELREFAETAAAFARTRLAEPAAEAEETDAPPAALLTRPAEQGLWTLGAPERHGGGGADLLALALAVAGVATAAPAVAAAMAGVHAALHAVPGDAAASLVSGAAEASLPILIDTRSPGSTLRITPSAGEGRVEGTVPRVEGAAQAAIFVVLDDEAGAVILDPGQARIGPPLRRTGLRGWPPCPVTFTGASGPVVPCAADRARQTLAVLLAAAASGVASAAATKAEEYTATRNQFGAPIADLPAVATLAAAMSADARECATEALTEARSRAGDIPPDPATARSAAVRRARTAVTVADRAIQLHGGYGYLAEYPVEHALRDAVTLRALITAIPDTDAPR